MGLQRRKYGPNNSSAEYAAYLGFADDTIDVFFQQESVVMQRLGRLFNGCDVPHVVVIPFLERQPWIAGLHALRFGSGEWNERAAQTTQIRRP